MEEMKIGFSKPKDFIENWMDEFKTNMSIKFQQS